MKSFLFTFCLAVLILHHVSATCSLPVPTGLKLKNQTSCSVDVSWKKVTGVSYYQVEYRITGSGSWSFIVSNGTSITISALASNTSYDFAVASFCIDNTTAGYSAALSKTTQKCSPPINISVSAITINSAAINWTPLCGSNNFILQYRVQGNNTWTKIPNISTLNYTLQNLQNSTTYEYRLQTNCGAVKSSWSPVATFITGSQSVAKKNIILFVLDDARYDEFQPNGAPSWFNTPGITKIANEGVNFKLTIPTTSQCAPSRASIYTGVYPHINGVEKNGDTLDSSFPLIQQILKDHDYYTGFVGKYGQFLGEPKGFNWWATSDGDVYIDPNYTINGKDTAISGHITDVYAQLAKTFLNSVPAGKNFALYFFTRIPHMPTIPRSQDSLLYLNETIPFPTNFSYYTNNFPDFYEDEEWNADSADARAYKLTRFQTLKGADDNMDSILSWVQQRDGTLDSTLILFTSDNGYLLGEHRLHEKVLALEESFRVPLFIRYPKWFNANSVINDEFATNIDIATTLLDYTGIPNTYGFQGLSYRQLAGGLQQRKNFFYESGWDPYIARLRAVRTLTDVYIRSYCKTTTEEYYDLVTDPLNNTNQIFNSAYQSTITSRRTLLDSLRGVFNDEEPKNKKCSLINSGQRVTVFADDETPSIDFMVGPNPAATTFSIYFTSHDKAPALITVYDELGHSLWSNLFQVPLDVMEDIDCSSWSNGIYFVKVEQSGKIYSQKVLISE